MGQTGALPVREGDLLAGKYRVERVIGSGGMGVVVAARHEQLGQLVAIKLVRDEALEQGDTVERFLREARAAVNLRSEHVAKVLDVGKLDSGAPYMVMEFLDGNDLGHVLNESGPMALDAALLLLLQACEAVAEAHAAGIVHRDLKPQNLFLTRTFSGSPRLKVLDFGVSKAIGLTKDGLGALTRTRAMLGSPLYMAPEQMRSSRDVDARVDVWALGVVLFELLTRRWPFEAESMPELCLKVVTEAPRPLSEFRSDVPPGVVAVIQRCLAKEPAGRYANATELAAALEPFAPPLMSRVAADRPRTTLIAAPTSSQPVDIARPTLPSAESSPVASGPTPSAWGGAPAGPLVERRRSRLAVPLVAALLIGATVASGVLLARRSARVGAAASLTTESAPMSAAALPPAVHSLVAMQADILPTASIVALPEPVATSPSEPARAEASSAKHEAPPPPPRPVVHWAPPSGPAPGRTPGNSRPPIPDDDIPALR